MAFFVIFVKNTEAKPKMGAFLGQNGYFWAFLAYFGLKVLFWYFSVFRISDVQRFWDGFLTKGAKGVILEFYNMWSRKRRQSAMFWAPKVAF